MSDESNTESTPAVSPTGTPWLPPGVVPWLVLAYAVTMAVLGTLTVQYPETRGFSVALSIVGALGAALGLASPGLRSAVKVLVVGVLAGGLTMGCALFQKAVVLIPAEVQSCGAKAVDVYQEVTAALELPTYEEKLLALAATVPGGYGLVKCLVATFIAWNSPKDSTAAGLLSIPEPPQTPLDRARAWRASHP